MFWNLSTPAKNTIIPQECLGCVLAYCTCHTWRSPIGRSPPHQSDSSFLSLTLTCVLHFPHQLYFLFQHFLISISTPPPLFRFASLDLQLIADEASLSRSMRGWAPRSAPNQTGVNRIMLRFRPIAPKPVGENSAAGAADQSKTDLTGRRVKRKYVRIRARQSKRRPKSKVLEEGKLPSPPENSGVEDAPPPEKGSVTLQLLAERSEKICDDASKEKWREDVDDSVSYASTAAYGGGPVDLNAGGSAVETWIVVEGVTDKFTGVGLGFSDKEKVYNLERDTCPGFVSDWSNNVIWVNSEYKKMVAEEESAAGEKGFLVWLVVKEEIPLLCPSFACRVRVTQQNGQGQKWNKIVPCDVWRMEFGGFAWKLDVNTALSLGF